MNGNERPTDERPKAGRSAAPTAAARRRVTAGCLSLALTVGCASENVSKPPLPPIDWRSFQVAADAARKDAGPPAPTAKERALAEDYCGALAFPGFDGLRERLDDDAQFAFPGMPDSHGRDAVVHAHELLFGSFEDRKVGVQRIWRTDSAQVVEFTLSGTHARVWTGISATHKPVTLRAIALLSTKDDGAIVEIHIYFDVAAVLAQIGAAPAGFPPRSGPAAATDRPQVFDRLGTGEQADALDRARVMLDALEGNVEAYVGAVADDVEIHTLERAEPARGKEAAHAYYVAMHKAIGEIDTTLRRGWGVSQFALVEYSVSGEQLGPIGWIPAHSTRVVRLHVVDVLEFRGTKVIQIWRYDNPYELVAPFP